MPRQVGKHTTADTAAKAGPRYAKDVYTGPAFTFHVDNNKNFQAPSFENLRKAWKLAADIEKRVLTLNGLRYLSVPDAAKAAQADPRTFHRWIENRTKFDGQRLLTCFLQGVERQVVLEDSVLRAANRFIKWPSKQRAGAVQLGNTSDGVGYIGMKEAAEKLGIARPTMNLWASDHDKAPLGRPLDVIKCSVSGQLHIRESELAELAHYIPRNGLSRGPRLEP